MGSVRVSPATVPATGSQTSILTLGAPAMVRLSAKSGPGTACSIVDKVRGPFAQSGEVGKQSCELDLLLDGGSYKLRLDSPPRGKGTVQITARPFPEINPQPPRLDKGQRIEATLRAGEKASFWLSLPTRAAPFLHIVGKNAGEVRLWRSGEWLEPVTFDHGTFTLGQGRAVHEWRYDGLVEAGEYLVTVYGTGGLGGSSGEASDALAIESGFAPLPSELAVTFTLPATGTLAYQVPKGRGAFLLSLDAPPELAFEYGVADLLSPSYLGLVGAPDKPLPPERGLVNQSRYKIEAKRLVPEGGVHMHDDEAHVVLLRGAPGTTGLLEWAPAGTGTTRIGGYYGAGERESSFDIETQGDYLVGLHDLPADLDAAPLGCQLLRNTKKGPELIGRDVLAIGDGQELDRELNYDGKGAVVWFEVARAGRYRIQTAGERKNRCEVWRIGDGGELSHVSESKPDAKSCSETLALNPGVYQVSLYDGLSGIERLSIREDSARRLTPVPPKAGCLILTRGLTPGRYTLAASRGGSLVSRGLVVQPLPLSLDAPVHLTLDPGRSLKLPIAGTGVARAAAGKSFGCYDRPTSGPCPLRPSTLTLSNPGGDVVAVTLLRPSQPKPPPAPVAFSPTAAPLPRASLDHPVYFDFERTQSHSLVLDVDRAGLYNVTTLGLLATECRLRTPVIPDVARDFGSGRGRNCLVSSYLRPGRYLLTATTTGQARGRAGILMTRRPPREYQAVGGDGEAFFRVEAGELVEQRLNVGRAADYELGTTAAGVKLQCRLDDPDGWPILEVPTPCSQTRRFGPGSYLWTQLPLTVESMRHTRLKRVREKVVLKGNRPHPIEFFTHYAAELGADGKDEFLFQLPGELTFDVVLTAGMQGRIYQLFPDRPPRPVEVVPARPEPSREGESAGGEGESAGDTPPPETSSEGEGERHDESDRPRESGESGESGGEGQTISTAEAPPALPPPPPLREAPPPPAGVRLTLAAGSYKLVTEHSRGDVGVSYELHLGSQVLLPGMTRQLPVPVVVPVDMPRDGTLRLRTDGEADVRCRLFQGERLVFASADIDGRADWNCQLAEPLAAGHYRLVIEARLQRPGETRLSLTAAPTEDAGLARDGATLSLGAAVALLSLPPAERDTVYEVGLRGGRPFACAVEDGAGRVLHRLTGTTACPMLIRPGGERYRLRVWALGGTAQVTVSLAAKPVIPTSRGGVPGSEAHLVTLPRAGRYATSPSMHCLGGALRGLLMPCGPEASLEAGPTLFAAFGTGEQALPLDEKLGSAAAATPLLLSGRPWIQGLAAPKPSVFLLAAEAQHGERTAPACAFESGVRESRERACFAASGVTTTPVARLWTAAGPTAPLAGPLPVQVFRRAVVLPASASVLEPGRMPVPLGGEAALFALPATLRSRLEMTLPGDAWAVLLDGGGNAVDLCAPIGGADALARCLMSGQGGKLLVVAGAGSVRTQATITTILTAVAERSATFTSLYEDTPAAPGTLRLRVPAAAIDRVAAVEGQVGCTLILSDGSRVAGCVAAVPRGLAVELKLEHGTAPLRAMVYAPGQALWTRLGMQPAKAAGSPLPPAMAVATFAAGGQPLDRVLSLPRDTAVRISADAGVCALFRGPDLLGVDGLGAGCELTRLLPAGTYRLLVRPFPGRPAPGLMRWTAEPVATLTEGVGGEELLAPGESRVYRFATASKGWIGLGLQARAETLDCHIYDRSHRQLGDGCHQYLQLDTGSYLLTVRLPARPGAAPLRIRPVLLGLAGAKADVPADYLKDLFRRIGANP